MPAESKRNSTSTSLRHVSLDEINERKFVVALARGLDLLRAFRPGETLLGNRDFVERTGLPKATVNRLAYTLTTLGYLRFDEPAGKYALDTGVLLLGFTLLAGADMLELALARPHMRALAREIGAAVSLGCRDGLDMIYLETIRSETALTLGLAPGSRLSMLTSSMGRAYLAVQELAAREALFEELGRNEGTEKVDAARLAIEDYARGLRARWLLLFVPRMARRRERDRRAVSRSAQRTLARAVEQRAAAVVDGRGVLSGDDRPEAQRAGGASRMKAQSTVRTCHSSGNSTTSSILRRYGAPAVPPLKPMMRSTVVTCRKRHCRNASSRSTSSSAISYRSQ